MTRQNQDKLKYWINILVAGITAIAAACSSVVYIITKYNEHERRIQTGESERKYIQEKQNKNNQQIEKLVEENKTDHKEIQRDVSVIKNNVTKIMTMLEPKMTQFTYIPTSQKAKHQ